MASDLQKKYQNPIDVSQVCFSSLPRSTINQTALEILPPDVRNLNVFPIKTTSDGNCLFNSASLAVCGKEVLNSEIRLRTALEFIVNHDFFPSYPAVIGTDIITTSGKQWPIESIYAVILSNHTSGVLTARTFSKAIKVECCNTIHRGEFSGILQVMGLASAIRCNVKMIYPDKRHKFFALLNGTYHSRENRHCCPTITIRWTNTSGWQTRTNAFYPTHFVPLLPVMADQNTWKTVTSKKTETLADL